MPKRFYFYGFLYFFGYCFFSLLCPIALFLIIACGFKTIKKSGPP